MDFDSPPKPDSSELMSVTCQTVSLFKSMDLDSQPKPLSKLISLITQLLNSIDSDSELPESLIAETLTLDPEPELVSLIYQIFSVVVSMYSKSGKLVSLCPRAQVYLEEDGRFRVIAKVPLMMTSRSNNKWGCLPDNWKKLKLSDEGVTHFHCRNCNGEHHGEYKEIPIESKHPLHQKHYLQLVWFNEALITRECYCCDEYLREFFYYCFVCDYAMNVACVEKPQVLSMNHPKWHEHTLALFPRKACLTCELCALSDSTCPFYVCPPCDFVVHRRCISLPRVIRISRHLHRISFTSSFDQKDWSCSVCRRKIENDYGGYSCINDGCCYAAHSRCATQSNVWDGIELEGVPEEVEEDVAEPFVRISDGIIRHFSHQHHHLRLDEDTSRDYDESKMCQACVMPIYCGNFYSCTTQCGFILHEACASLSRKIHHPVHPHMLTLVVGYDGVRNGQDICSTCTRSCVAGFYYECGKNDCYFKVHVQCATISEPLVHESHMHPLFLTSKPGECRKCCVCKFYSSPHTHETFNCIECDFALCFECATLPQKVRYKHDKHMLGLSYGEETSTMTYWCELCETKLNPNGRFYKCDEYCCVTLHIECLLGKELYMKPGSSWFYSGTEVGVLANNQHMSRPICSDCGKRCPQKIVFQLSGKIFCSGFCFKIYI